MRYILLVFALCAVSFSANALPQDIWPPGTYRTAPIVVDGYFSRLGLTFGQVCFTPILLPANVPVKIGFGASGANSGDKARIALYSSDLKYGMPAKLFIDAGEILIPTSPVPSNNPIPFGSTSFSAISIPVSVGGIYWIGVEINRPSPALFDGVNRGAVTDSLVVPNILASNAGTLSQWLGQTYCAAQTYGAFPINSPKNLTNVPVGQTFLFLASRP
jgi:hypothetical protein